MGDELLIVAFNKSGPPRAKFYAIEKKKTLGSEILRYVKTVPTVNYALEQRLGEKPEKAEKI